MGTGRHGTPAQGLALGSADLPRQRPRIPFYQFEVTTALGRFAGFWDEHDTFQIVLLDRLHNLQPAKKHNYTTRKTRVIESPHASLLAELDAISKGTGCGPDCGTRAQVAEAIVSSRPKQVIIAHVEPATADAVALCEYSMNDLVGTLIDELVSNAPGP